MFSVFDLDGSFLFKSFMITCQWVKFSFIFISSSILTNNLFRYKIIWRKCICFPLKLQVQFTGTTIILKVAL